MPDRPAVKGVEANLPASVTFLIEEYRLKWEYLRHVEQGRDSLVKWYATLIGSLAALSLGVAAKGLDAASIRPLRRTVLLFCLFYSLFVAGYVLVQKRNYRHYHERVEQIEDRLAPRTRNRPKRNVFWSSFRIYYTFPVAIGAGVAGLLVFTISQSLGWAWGAATGYFALVMAATWAKCFR